MRCGFSRLVPRMVPPTARMFDTSLRWSGRAWFSTRPRKPFSMPMTSMWKSLIAGLTTPRMAAFRPGQSPPLVRIPTTRVRLWIMTPPPPLGWFLFIMAASCEDGMLISSKPRDGGPGALQKKQRRSNPVSATATKRLRELLRKPGIIRSLGAHDVFTARLVEAAGLETVFIGGFGTSASLLGLPDVGFLTLTEM